MNADQVVHALRNALPSSPLFDGGMTDDVHLLLTLGDVAKRQTLPAFRRREVDRSMGRDQLGGAWIKDDGSWVSRADLKAERAVRSAVRLQCPEDSVLGEEDGLTAGTNHRLWSVDPIDGSTSFLFGFDTWGTLISLQVNGGTELALVQLPALGELLFAVRGHGAYSVRYEESTLTAQRIAVNRLADLGRGALALSGVSGLSTLPLGDGTLEDTFILVRNSAAHWRKLGNSLSPAQVAKGVAVAGWGSDLSPAYDVPTTELLVGEAGGRVSQLPLPPTRGGNGVAMLYSNAVIHDQLLGALVPS